MARPMRLAAPVTSAVFPASGFPVIIDFPDETYCGGGTGVVFCAGGGAAFGFAGGWAVLSAGFGRTGSCTPGFRDDSLPKLSVYDDTCSCGLTIATAISCSGLSIWYSWAKVEKPF